MRKKDFKTTNKKFTVESGAGEEGTDQLSYKYKKDTPGQSTNGKTMKKEKFVPTTVKNEDVADFMGAVSQAAAAGKKEFKFGGKTYKVTLKNKGVAKKIVKSMDEASDKELDIKSIEDLMKNPDARMIKQYGSKSKYLKMLKSKLDRLNEAAANDYADLSDKEISTMIALFRNVSRKAAAPILTALKREKQKRSLKEDYQLYHPTFTAAAKAASDLAKKKGFEVDEDDWFNQVSTGPKKPGKGKTNRYVVKVTKKGKETKKRLAFQVYGMDSGKYELNAYVESTQIQEVNESTMDKVNAIVSDKQAAKIGGKMIDMQTASVIAQIYNKVSDAAKKKMENEKIERLVKFAQQVMKKEDNANNKSDDGEGLDKVQPKAVKKKFDDRKDKDIDNDGDVDSSDEYIHAKRKAISKAIKSESTDLEEDYQKVLDKMVKNGSNKKEAEALMKRLYPYVDKTYRSSSVSKKAEIIVSLAASESTDLEEAIVYRDIRHAIELLRTTPGATKFRDSLMKKDQDAKISSSDLKKAKEIFANMSTIDSANVEKKRKDRYFPRFGVKALEESIKENIGVEDGRRVIVKALTKPAALRLQKKLRNKFNSYDFNIDKSGLSIIVPNEKHITRFINKQPEVDTIGESTDLEEAIMWWTVTITKKAGKLFKGQTVDVKARNSAEAIKKGIKQMKGNPILVPSGSVDAALFSIKESVNENRAIVHNPKGINAFIRQVEKKFPQYKGEIEQLEDDEIIFPDDEKLKKFFKGAREVKFVLADAVDLEETAATTQMVIKALKLKGGSKATALAQKLSAPEYVNAPLPKSVINTAKKLLKGQITKFVKEAADLEKTNVLSSDEYDEVQNFKNFNKRDWKWDKKKSLYVRKKKVNEAADLEEAASPFKSLEAAWLRTAGDEKKQARLIKKHNLKQIISKVRPGAIKLGVMNDLNAKGKQNYTAAGLDADGELIFVTNNPTKIYYPKSNSKRPEGLALESIEFTRVKVIVERVTGVADVDFIVEYEVNSSWPASAILNAYTKYKILNG